MLVIDIDWLIIRSTIDTNPIAFRSIRDCL